MATTLRSATLGIALTIAAAGLAVASCGGDKDDKSKAKSTKAAPAHKLVKTELPALKLTMQAPEGAKVTGKGVVFISKGETFAVDIQKDIYGASGDKLIIPFEKKLLKTKLVDKPDLQIWTKDMGGQRVVLFAMVVKVGAAKYYVQSNGMGTFNRAQVDAMVAAVRTLAAK